MASHLRVSKAFLRSRLPNPCNILSSIIMLSEVFLPEMKADWCEEMSLLNNLATMSTKNCASSLYMRLARTIGFMV